MFPSVTVCVAQFMYVLVAILFLHVSVLGYVPSLEINNERKVVFVAFQDISAFNVPGCVSISP